MPVPRREMLRYGGNTSCVEVRSPETLLIIDAGTGVVPLGDTLTGTDQRIYMAFSHCHWDHIMGFPFFAPLHRAGTHVSLYGSTVVTGRLDHHLRNQMENPYFPVRLETLSAGIEFVNIEPGHFEVGDLKIDCRSLVHPQGVLGFRVEHDGAVMVYASDSEHGADEGMDRLVALAMGADLLVADAQYDPVEYESQKKGWGHGTWEQAALAAAQAQVQQLVLFHHDPWRRDEDVFVFENEAREIFPQTVAGAEGAVFHLKSRD